MRTIETTLQDLQSLRESGLKLREIAAQIGVSKSTVFRRVSSAASAAARQQKQPDRVTPEQLEECRSDPAWEPRQKIANRVVCRECGEFRESALNFPDGGHLKRIHDLRSDAYLTKWPGAPLGPKKIVPYVRREQLEECRLDPAWESRPEQELADRLVCRECGALCKITVRTHLRSRHGLERKDYLKKWPSARLYTFDQVVKVNASQPRVKQKRSAAELMQDMASSFVTAAELIDCRGDIAWEDHRGITTFVVCRKCGFKSKCALTEHLKTHYRTEGRLCHGEMTVAYHVDYPGAPTAAPSESPNRRAQEAAYQRTKLKLDHGRIMAALDSKSDNWKKIIPQLLMHPAMGNKKILELAGISSTDAPTQETLRQMRNFAGVRGPRGRVRGD